MQGWYQVDPKAEHDMASSTYASMYNNPISYNDPLGDCPNCIAAGIGAVIGGIGNLAYQGFTGNINSVSDGFAAFGIGAAAGAAAGFTGGASLAATGAGTTFAGAVGAGALSGAAGGATAGLIQGTGNSLYFGNNSLGEALGVGLTNALYGAAFGAVTGGIIGGATFKPNSVPGGPPNKAVGPANPADEAVVNASVETGRQAARFPDGRIYIDGPDGWTLYNPSSRIVNTSARQLQKKFKHAIDFGIDGNFNRVNAAQFNSAINKHINSSAIKAIQGTYRGNPVTHFVNANTGLNVIVGPNNQFISGWRLGAQQLMNVLKHGGLN